MLADFFLGELKALSLDVTVACFVVSRAPCKVCLRLVTVRSVPPSLLLCGFPPDCLCRLEVGSRPACASPGNQKLPKDPTVELWETGGNTGAEEPDFAPMPVGETCTTGTLSIGTGTQPRGGKCSIPHGQCISQLY